VQPSLASIFFFSSDSRSQNSNDINIIELPCSLVIPRDDTDQCRPRPAKWAILLETGSCPIISQRGV